MKKQLHGPNYTKAGVRLPLRNLEVVSRLTFVVDICLAALDGDDKLIGTSQFAARDGSPLLLQNQVSACETSVRHAVANFQKLARSEQEKETQADRFG